MQEQQQQDAKTWRRPKKAEMGKTTLDMSLVFRLEDAQDLGAGGPRGAGAGKLLLLLLLLLFSSVAGLASARLPLPA